MALAGAGELDRAEAVARSISDPGRQARALAVVAVALARAGDPDRALQAAHQAEAAARSVTNLGGRAQALADVAMALARARDPNMVGPVAPHEVISSARYAAGIFRVETALSERSLQLLASVLANTMDYVPLLSPLAKVEPTAVIQAAENIRTWEWH